VTLFKEIVVLCSITVGFFCHWCYRLVS